MYASTTHCTPAVPVRRPAVIDGTATFTTVTSSSTRNMPAHITTSTSPARRRGADEPDAAATGTEDDFGVSLALLGLRSTGLGCRPVTSMPVEVSPRHTGVMATVIASGGDVDIAAVAALFADRTRARMLVALSDGRALPASVLATEAGVSPQAASAQLSRLQAAGLLAVEQSGRHRYYRLATGQVSAILEALAQLAPAQPVRSLRQSTRAAALRSARACYDHLAGKLGVELTQALIDHRALTPTDGIPDARRRSGDRLSSQLADHPWVLGPSAGEVFGGLGVVPGPARRRPPVTSAAAAVLPGLERAAPPPGGPARGRRPGRAARRPLGHPRPGSALRPAHPARAAGTQRPPRA